MPPKERAPGARRPPAPEAAAPSGPRASLAPVALVAALVSLALYVGAMTLFKMSNNDIWIHLKTGEYVVKTAWVPIKDPYSFVASDRDYVAHEWLAGVLFYLVYSAGGVTALIWFKSLLLAVTSAILIWTARVLGSRLDVILPAFCCLLYIASARFLERPHIFSYFMAALYLLFFFSYRERGRNRIWLALIPPAHAVWTNLHGGYVQGFFLVVTFALGETLAWARARWLGLGRERALPDRDLAMVAGLVPACILATLVNPYGFRLVTFPFELTGLKLFMQSIYEWQPPYHLSYNTSTMVVFFMLHVGTLCVSFFAAHRDRTAPRSGPRFVAVLNLVLMAAFLLTFLIMALLWRPRAEEIAQTMGPTPRGSYVPTLARLFMFLPLGYFSLFTVVNVRSVDFTQAGVFALFYLLALRHNRAVTDAAMGTFPILAASLSAVLDRRLAGAAAPARAPARRPAARGAPEPAAPPEETPPRRAGRSSPAAVLAGSALLAAVAVHAHFDKYYFDFTGSGREKGFGIADNMPVCAVEFIARSGITGNAFVSYPFAALLIHRTHPHVKVNMDSRNDVYLEDLYTEYLAALRFPDSMREYLARRRIDFFLLSYGDRSAAVFDWLESTGEWAPVYYDARAFVLVRRRPETEELLRREELRAVRPMVVAPTTISTANAAQILEESERLIRNCPSSTFGHVYKTRALLVLGRYEDAVEAARAALELDPRSAQSHADLGAAYQALGRKDRAIEAFENALRHDPGFAPAVEGLRRLRGF
jgi:tetratricopeptide (TPR) repeat protein